MFMTIRKFFRLPAADKWFLLESALTLGSVTVALKLVPRAVLRYVSGIAVQTVSRGREPAELRLARVCHGLSVSARYMPWTKNCLSWAVAGQILLARRGEPSQLQIGVARGEGGKIDAHAWLECHGCNVIGGNEDLSRYKALPLRAPSPLPAKSRRESVGRPLRPWVLVLGDRADASSRELAEHLRCREVKVGFFSPSSAVSLSWPLTRCDEQGFLATDEGEVPLGAISGVLLRTALRFTPGSGQLESDHEYMAEELRATLTGLLSSLECLVVNRPTPEAGVQPLFTRKENIAILSENGLRLPETFVTSDAGEAMRFYAHCGSRAVLGSPSGRESWRPVRGRKGVEAIRAALPHRPIYLQALPRGRWVQVFVVGRKAFEAGQGWRARLLGEGLSPSLARRCVLFSQALRLDFALITLRRTAQGDQCYGVNPFPAWTGRGRLSGDITAGLAALLVGEGGPAR